MSESLTNYNAIDLENISKNPYCHHGPTILFTLNGKKKFYACSACRDKKQCSFYYEYNEKKKVSDEKFNFWFERYKEENDKITSQNCFKLDKILKLNPEKRIYCRTCNLFLDDKSRDKHQKNHSIITNISDETIKHPIEQLITPIEINSANAQYVFDKKTIALILRHIEKFEFDSVLCIGAPRVFENLPEKTNAYLLDIDARFNQFYDETKFSRFNMFNYHFFVQNNKISYLNFINNSKKLFVIIDPPFGGLIKLVAFTIESIKKEHNNVSFFLFYPYFNESWIKHWLPDFNMVDYKVSYDNQKKYSKNTTYKKGSPARIFTNIKLNKIQLDTNDGYKYCGLCEKYTYMENRHCNLCQKCTSKDGGFYTHCNECKKCVKASYRHCNSCKICHLNECNKSEFLLKNKKRKLSD